MSDHVVFDPDALAGHGDGVADAVDELRRAVRDVDGALDDAQASGHVGSWAPGWFRPTDHQDLPRRLGQLGAFTSWLAERAATLDVNADGLVQATPGWADSLRSGLLFDTRERITAGAQFGRWATGHLHTPPTEVVWGRWLLLADDPTFAAAALLAIGGVPGLVDALLAAHHRLAPGVAGPDLPGADPGRIGDAAPLPIELDRVVRLLGGTLGASTRSGDWTDRDTATLSGLLRAAPGDEDFAPGRAAAVGILAGAGQMAPPVLANLLATAVAVEQSDGGMAAWARRAAGADTAPWPRALRDRDGQVATDVTSSLLAAADTPDQALALFRVGPTVPGPLGAPGRVDATLSHLLLDHAFDEVGWDRLSAVLTTAVTANRGRGDTGLAAAGVAAQATTLAATRIRRTGALPAPLRPGMTALLDDTMHAVVPTMAGVDPADWVAQTPDPWTYRDAGVHPGGLPVQPRLAAADVEVVVERLGSDLEAIERLTRSAMATLPVFTGAAGATGDVETMATTAAPVGRAVGVILGAGHAGVVVDHRAAERHRTGLSNVGAVLGLLPVPAVSAAGVAMQQVAQHDLIVHESAVPEDYAGRSTELAERLRLGLLDHMLVEGVFRVVPDAAVRRDADGLVVGFRHGSGAFASWPVHDPAAADAMVSAQVVAHAVVTNGPPAAADD
ncbi:hypothetical protein [Salsipaludibacter albus]|uniref:hypothetical protein n=1 Tax=Salsipaludibacter albus TaxID=2849650 RepID=UPI001EE4D779|nr:hypothetical protein [Salsipaludibacter albus]MBY5162025.1 hypothetical protein [Salsipaludibacter albus]